MVRTVGSGIKSSNPTGPTQNTQNTQNVKPQTTSSVSTIQTTQPTSFGSPTQPTNAEKATQAALQAQSTQQDKINIKKSLDSMKTNLRGAGGGNMDTGRIADYLTKLKPGQPVDPSVQSLLPAIANILSTQQTASSVNKAAGSVGQLMAQSQKTNTK